MDVHVVAILAVLATLGSTSSRGSLLVWLALVQLGSDLGGGISPCFTIALFLCKYSAPTATEMFSAPEVKRFTMARTATLFAPAGAD